VKILAGTKLKVLISAYRNLEVFGRLQHKPNPNPNLTLNPNPSYPNPKPNPNPKR